MPPRARDAASAEQRLLALLQLAYSGERAAALAYGGHWRSVRDTDERRRIREIEEEELDHRRQVGEMIVALGGAPDAGRERRARLIGSVLGALCHVSGWLLPMYGAGRLESRNVREYEVAARLAWASGRAEWVDCLLTMAEVEWEHEAYFRSKVQSHRLGRRLPAWTAPGSLASIRATFAEETGAEAHGARDAAPERAAAVG